MAESTTAPLPPTDVSRGRGKLRLSSEEKDAAARTEGVESDRCKPEPASKVGVEEARSSGGIEARREAE
jgi:hypothetical protein